MYLNLDLDCSKLHALKNVNIYKYDNIIIYIMYLNLGLDFSKMHALKNVNIYI